MHWFSQFQLFMFDLDGLLVNTEELHFQAYKRMLEARGYVLEWDFAKYFSIAQSDSDAPKRYIYAEFPELEKEEPDWNVLYAEKKKAYLNLLQQEAAPLMPGVRELLALLDQKNVKTCVVTHSSKALVDCLVEKNPLLRTIPHWITREDYSMAKPAPDGYLQAIERYADIHDRIIGFEDSSRGLRALLATRANPILVNGIDEQLRSTTKQQGVKVFSTFYEVLEQESLL